jgi:hypothetical protein
LVAASSQAWLTLRLPTAADIIGGCPSQSIAPVRAHGVVRAVRRAAEDYATSVLNWPAVAVRRACRVGTGGIYDEVYAKNIPRSCGQAIARASYGVDVWNPLGDSSAQHVRRERSARRI